VSNREERTFSFLPILGFPDGCPFSFPDGFRRIAISSVAVPLRSFSLLKRTSVGILGNKEYDFTIRIPTKYKMLDHNHHSYSLSARTRKMNISSEDSAPPTQSIAAFSTPIRSPQPKERMQNPYDFMPQAPTRKRKRGNSSGIEEDSVSSQNNTSPKKKQQMPLISNQALFLDLDDAPRSPLGPLLPTIHRKPRKYKTKNHHQNDERKIAPLWFTPSNLSSGCDKENTSSESSSFSTIKSPRSLLSVAWVQQRDSSSSHKRARYTELKAVAEASESASPTLPVRKNPITESTFTTSMDCMKRSLGRRVERRMSGVAQCAY